MMYPFTTSQALDTRAANSTELFPSSWFKVAILQKPTELAGKASMAIDLMTKILFWNTPDPEVIWILFYVYSVRSYYSVSWSYDWNTVFWLLSPVCSLKFQFPRQVSLLPSLSGIFCFVLQSFQWRTLDLIRMAVNSLFGICLWGALGLKSFNSLLQFTCISTPMV